MQDFQVSPIQTQSRRPGLNQGSAVPSAESLKTLVTPDFFPYSSIFLEFEGIPEEGIPEVQPLTLPEGTTHPSAPRLLPLSLMDQPREPICVFLLD